MAKAILEFDLNDIDDRVSHKISVKALDMLNSLWEFDKHLRSEIKYNSERMSEEVFEEYKKMRDKLHVILTENNISFDEFIH